MHMGVLPAYMPGACADKKRLLDFLWNWSYRRFQTTMCVLETKSRSSWLSHLSNPPPR